MKLFYDGGLRLFVDFLYDHHVVEKLLLWSTLCLVHFSTLMLFYSIIDQLLVPQHIDCFLI